MLFSAAKTFGLVFSVALSVSTLVQAECPVDSVIVKGGVNHALGNAEVRVQLVYAKGVVGESGEAMVKDGAFSIPIEFLTQSRRPIVNGLPQKCNRRPKKVIVTLLQRDADHEYDRVTLDFVKDFKMVDASAYAPGSDLVLNGSH
ncbi:MAG: hypothetical protein WB729_09150 [Candidatus Sulfotelmatobacter sp.]